MPETKKKQTEYMDPFTFSLGWPENSLGQPRAARLWWGRGEAMLPKHGKSSLLASDTACITSKSRECIIRPELSSGALDSLTQVFIPFLCLEATQIQYGYLAPQTGFSAGISYLTKG